MNDNKNEIIWYIHHFQQATNQIATEQLTNFKFSKLSFVCLKYIVWECFFNLMKNHSPSSDDKTVKKRSPTSKTLLQFSQKKEKNTSYTLVQRNTTCCVEMLHCLLCDSATSVWGQWNLVYCFKQLYGISNTNKWKKTIFNYSINWTKHTSERKRMYSKKKNWYQPISQNNSLEMRWKMSGWNLMKYFWMSVYRTYEMCH